jgi:hypothetical protein
MPFLPSGEDCHGYAMMDRVPEQLLSGVNSHSNLLNFQED